jgi:hypothetical protein
VPYVPIGEETICHWLTSRPDRGRAALIAARAVAGALSTASRSRRGASVRSNGSPGRKPSWRARCSIDVSARCGGFVAMIAAAAAKKAAPDIAAT